MFNLNFRRAKEWLLICDRPDLMRRVDLGEINVNNYYVCEQHFPNQILDYATRKILIKTATPLSLTESKLLPFSAAGLMMNALNGLVKQKSNDELLKRDENDSYDDDDNDNGKFQTTPFDSPAYQVIHSQSRRISPAS